jgi:hypothetical protein
MGIEAALKMFKRDLCSSITYTDADTPGYGYSNAHL